MSDELRDALRARGDAIDVPAGDLDGVVRGGRGLKVRRIAMATTATAVVIAVVAWGATNGGSFLDGDEGRVADPGPSETVTPTPTPSASAGEGGGADCDSVPFRPTYLPEGWSYVLQDGEGGQRGIPTRQQSPYALGHYRPMEGSTGPHGGFIDVFQEGAYYSLGVGGEPIEVLGAEGRIGAIEDGDSVEFEYEGCGYAVMAFGPPKNELRRVAESFVPREDCTGDDIEPVTDVTADGRLFGKIKALSGTALELDRAEFLTGEEANQAAVEDGYIEEGETVPNDYYIDDLDQQIMSLPISRDVVVQLETYAQDGQVGLATWELPDVVCIFEGAEPIHHSHPNAYYWITVTEGLVTRIEEQYVP